MKTMTCLIGASLLMILSARAAAEEIIFTDIGTKYKFHVDDFVKESGEAIDGGWGLTRADVWRGRCFVHTPAVVLNSTGSLFVSVSHVTNWHGELASPEEAWDTELFTIKVSYTTADKQRKLVKKYVSLGDLPRIKKLLDMEHEADYYRGETIGVMSSNLDNAIRIDQLATDIEVSVCNVAPGTRLAIRDISVETDGEISQ
jgi:hypothetical protein